MRIPICYNNISWRVLNLREVIWEEGLGTGGKGTSPSKGKLVFKYYVSIIMSGLIELARKLSLILIKTWVNRLYLNKRRKTNKRQQWKVSLGPGLHCLSKSDFNLLKSEPWNSTSTLTSPSPPIPVPTGITCGFCAQAGCVVCPHFSLSPLSAVGKVWALKSGTGLPGMRCRILELRVVMLSKIPVMDLDFPTYPWLMAWRFTVANPPY